LIALNVFIVEYIFILVKKLKTITAILLTVYGMIFIKKKNWYDI